LLADTNFLNKLFYDFQVAEHLGRPYSLAKIADELVKA
jgi:hypothetical protein